MSGPVIHQPRREAPLNHNTSRAINAHAVEDILGRVDLNILSHDETMTSGHKYGRAHKSDTYRTKYLESTPEFTMDSQREM